MDRLVKKASTAFAAKTGRREFLSGTLRGIAALGIAALGVWGGAAYASNCTGVTEDGSSTCNRVTCTLYNSPGCAFGPAHSACIGCGDHGACPTGYTNVGWWTCCCGGNQLTTCNRCSLSGNPSSYCYCVNLGDPIGC